jgi:hypothetical protein
MYLHVLLEIRAGGESFIAKLARVGLLPGVDPLVAYQVTYL